MRQRNYLQLIPDDTLDQASNIRHCAHIIVTFSELNLEFDLSLLWLNTFSKLTHCWCDSNRIVLEVILVG